MHAFTGGPCEGGGTSVVSLWDLRFISGGPVRQYAASTDTIRCLALEPRHGTLLGGGWRGITCWDRETGISRLVHPREINNHDHHVQCSITTAKAGGKPNPIAP